MNELDQTNREILEHLLERLVYFCIKWEFTPYELEQYIDISKPTRIRLQDNMTRFKRKDKLLGVHSSTIDKLKKFIASEELLEKQEMELLKAAPKKVLGRPRKVKHNGAS